MARDDVVEFQVVSTWTAVDVVQVPREDADEIKAEIEAGNLPEIVAEQISASGADLTDWEL